MNKNLQSKILTRSVEYRNSSEELLKNRQVEFIISSESVDTYRTVFIQDGGNFSRFTPKGIVLYAHDSHSSDEDNVLGYGEVFREGNLTIGKVTFEPKEINPKADKIFRKIENGTPYMASIGFEPIKASFGDRSKNEDPDVLYFREWNLLEFSVVPIGSNPDSNKRNAQTVEDIRMSLTKDIAVDFTDGGFVPGKEYKEKRTTKTVREAQLIINKNTILK